MTTSESLIEIHRTTLSDISLVAPLFDLYRQFYRQSPEPTGARRFLTERLECDESVIFHAMRGDEAVGFVQLYPSYSSVSMLRMWILNDLYVSEEARRQDVATLLMGAAEAFARDTRAKGLNLTTARDNLPAQGLYEQRGWKRDEAYYTYNFRF